MAKYMKTIELWSKSVVDNIRSGELVLQSGQWVTCGGEPKSIYIGCSKAGVIHLAHGAGADRLKLYNYKRQNARI